MAVSLPDFMVSSSSASISTWNTASRSAPTFLGMTTPSHHRWVALLPPAIAAGAATNSILPTILEAAGSSIRAAREAHNTPIAALPCWNWFITSSVLDASAFGVMKAIMDFMVSMVLTAASLLKSAWAVPALKNLPLKPA